VGEVIQPGASVFTVIDLKNIWITGYINETDLGKVKLNQVANIQIDTYPNKSYKGRVSFISQEAEFTPKHIQTVEERTKLVYRVKINVNNSDFELKPGMPADAYIQIK
jgi:HlyD family secretion protein